MLLVHSLKLRVIRHAKKDQTLRIKLEIRKLKGCKVYTQDVLLCLVKCFSNHELK